MKITYTLTGINDFHGRGPINLVISGAIARGVAGPMYRVSPSQERRISSHFCGVTDCFCAGGAVDILSPGSSHKTTEFGIRAALARAAL